MLKANLKEAIRWAMKKKVNTLLIICGMSIGITVSLLIGLWAMNEFSFDSFHTNGDRIYRVCRNLTVNNERITAAVDYFRVGKIAQEKYPDIEQICRIISSGRETIKVSDQIVNQDNIASTDPNFFRFFSFKLENGNAKTCLDAPDKMVIDKSTAMKYFGDKNPIGQTIELYNKKFHVSAIMEDFPENSHLKFHMINSVFADPRVSKDSWGEYDGVITYLLLKDGTDTKALAEKLTKVTTDQLPFYEKFNLSHFLQPLSDVHFSPGYRIDFAITSDRRIVIIFISLAALILLIATFNFINLFISSSILRAKSIGVKKINGSSKSSLLWSSFFETGIYIFISTFIALILTCLLLPSFNLLANSHLKLNFSDYRIYFFTGLLFLITVSISGIIPVLHTLRFNPSDIIRNRFKGSKTNLLQKSLIISQIAASIILISTAGFIQKQIHYIHAKDLGFNKEHIVYIFPYNMAGKYETVRNELLKNPNIRDVTAKNSLPTDWHMGCSISLAGSTEEQYLMEGCSMKKNYLDLMQIPLIEGRNPFEEGKDNNSMCMVNEAAVKTLGLTDPVGQQIYSSNDKYTIAGVIKNANTKSLHNKVDPQVYLYLHHLTVGTPILIKTSDQTASAIHSLEDIWKQYNPDVPFEYHFLNEVYDQLYKTEQTTSKIITIGMVIAFFLAFMGLYAISRYATERRIKEIGIRKVNGARISEILLLLNQSYIYWVIMAFSIATPISWFLLHKWLSNFAYQTTLSWWVFALAGFSALFIATATVTWQSWRAATKNPVKALRYE